MSSSLPGAPPCTLNHVQNQNAASGRLYGIEVDADILLPAGFDLRANLAYRSKFNLSVQADRGYDANNNEAPMEQMLVNNHWLITRAGIAGANGSFMPDDVPSSTVLNFTAGLDIGSERLVACASNIADEACSTKASINESVSNCFLNTPRLYGVRFHGRC